MLALHSTKTSTMQTNTTSKTETLRLTKDYGAYYQVHEMHNQPYYHQLWLCPVTEYVFGNYPGTIYAAVV
jgi:hypothetical protein